MPTILTETKIKTSKPKEKPYKLSDSHGLYMEVKPSGLKIWRYRYRIEGKETSYTIGEYPATSLAEARRLHQEARKLVREGISPVKARESEKAKNAARQDFEQMASEFIENRLGDKTENYRNQVRLTLRKYILPIIGHKKMAEVTPADVLEVIDKTMLGVRSKGTKRTGEASAQMSRQIISNVFQYAIMRLKADYDPTYATRRLIQRKSIQHARVLTGDELKKIIYMLDDYQGRSVRDAIRFMMLTMVRSKEVRLARWQDIDFENRQWCIPEHLMKMRRPHVIPLSDQAMQILQRRLEFREHAELIFNSPQYRTKPIGMTTINRALEYMDCGEATAHDFRATASTILNANGFNSDWIERQLAHLDKNAVRRSYNHADYLPERRQMLQWWADYLDNLKV